MSCTHKWFKITTYKVSTHRHSTTYLCVHCLKRTSRKPKVFTVAEMNSEDERDLKCCIIFERYCTKHGITTGQSDTASKLMAHLKEFYDKRDSDYQHLMMMHGITNPPALPRPI